MAFKSVEKPGEFGNVQSDSQLKDVMKYVPPIRATFATTDKDSLSRAMVAQTHKELDHMNLMLAKFEKLGMQRLEEQYRV